MTTKTVNPRRLLFSFIALLLLGATLPPAVVGCRDNKSSATTPGATPDTPSVPPGVTTEIPQVSLVKIADGFSSPTHIAHAGDGSNRLFIVEQRGTIKILENGSVLPEPFLDISSRVTAGGERGLFVVVFPSGFPAQKNYFYVNYTGTQGSGDTFISRFHTTANTDIADAASEQILLTIDQPFPNHNGGQMVFGPDGYLYVGMGDGGSADDPSGNGQNPGSLLGKLLRLDVESNPTGTYAVPSNNPFVGKQGYRPEIWALGLRNPWRFSFDRQTGDLYIADVGQDEQEELNLQPASGIGGENYGWNIMEGLECFEATSCDQTGLTLPVFAYDRADGNCSVTGGFVYRGQEFPALQGVYMYGDYCSGRIWGLRQVEEVVENKLLLESSLRISTFGEDEAGNLYVADLSGGDIYKIVVPPAEP